MNESKSAVRIEIEDFADTLGSLEQIILASVMTVVCVFTVAGNLLVLLSFAVDRKLRTPNNWFVLSLAVSDTMIGVFSMPLFTLYSLNGEWLYGPVVCDMWLAQDYACSCASSLHLVIIAIDRYFSVVSPLWYRARKNSKLVGSMIGSVWVISVLLWPPWIYAWQYIEGVRTVPEDDCYVQFLETNVLVTFVTSAVSYWLPVSVICFLYFRIWRVTVHRKTFLASMHSRSEAENSARNDDSKLGRNLKPEAIALIQTNPIPSDKPESKSPKSFRTDSGLNLVERPDDEMLTAGGRISTIPCRQEDTSFSIPVNCEAALSKPCSNNDMKTSEELERAAAFLRHNRKPCFPRSGSNMDDRISASQTIPVATSDLHSDKVATEQIPENSKREEPEKKVEEVNTGRKNTKLSDSCPGKPKTSGAKQQDNKAARMLAAILSAFLATATPYNVVIVIMTTESGEVSVVSDAVWFFVYYMFYINSALNPICYALANRQFRKTYWKVLKCTWWKKVGPSTGHSKRNLKSSSSATSTAHVSTLCY